MIFMGVTILFSIYSHCEDARVSYLAVYNYCATLSLKNKFTGFPTSHISNVLSSLKSNMINSIRYNPSCIADSI